MVTIALVGTGGMGTVHYSNYRHIENAKLVAVVGSSEKDEAKAKKWNLPYFNSISEMADRTLPNLVDICTPTFLHATHVREALNKNCSVICEKPFTLDPTEAASLFELAGQKDRFIYVAQVLQYTKESQYLKRVLEEQTYGNILSARFERLSAMPHWNAGGWMFDKDKSGLIPFDLHIHDLDLLVRLFGRPLDYELNVTKRASRDFPEQYRFVYRYDHFHVEAEAAWFDAPVHFTARWRVYLEDAMIVFEGGVLWVFPKAGEAFTVDIEDDVLIPTGINLPPTGWFYSELTSILRDYEQRRPSSEVSKEQVLTVIELLDDINRRHP
ncbi:MAG: Gfo/Idh/MocA family oxidoreductase [Eubacteriales bacterium]|nr:Gfo/Idh/MocA family oxidoreductase [Sphaerochaetaceae bacterium]MDD2572610.1 Gfo/Idh/MocA family oxidoreductase [Eubacteriales bacterium]MDD4186583.1 Gfo/Idh/MocA family oxidoreductase [Eubacteriales bacterium]